MCPILRTTRPVGRAWTGHGGPSEGVLTGGEEGRAECLSSAGEQVGCQLTRSWARLPAHVAGRVGHTGSREARGGHKGPPAAPAGRSAGSCSPSTCSATGGHCWGQQAVPPPLINPGRLARPTRGAGRPAGEALGLTAAGSGRRDGGGAGQSRRLGRPRPQPPSGQSRCASAEPAPVAGRRR